jgi:FHA domain
MSTCPVGHESAADDYCDQCGRRIGGAQETSSGAGGPASPGLTASAQGGGQLSGGQARRGQANGGAAAGESAAQLCPQCGTPRSGRFCEVCRFDFVAGTPTAPRPGPAPQAAPHPRPEPQAAAHPGPEPQATPQTGAAPSAPTHGPASASGETGATPLASAGSAPSAGSGTGATPFAPPASAGSQTGATPLASPGSAAAQTGATSLAPPGSDGTAWWAVVTADRDYFDRVVAVGGPEAAAISFPPYCPERRFSLGTSRAGEEKQIGRHSASRGIDPAIDLTGPPTDPGVSRLHAVLIGLPDGGWAVLDPGSENGTLVNDQEIPVGLQVPLHDGDRIHLGAWTSITIHGGNILQPQ